MAKENAQETSVFAVRVHAALTFYCTSVTTNCHRLGTPMNQMVRTVFVQKLQKWTTKRLFANNTVLGTTCGKNKRLTQHKLNKFDLKKKQDRKKYDSKAALFINSVNCIIHIYKVHLISSLSTSGGRIDSKFLWNGSTPAEPRTFTVIFKWNCWFRVIILNVKEKFFIQVIKSKIYTPSKVHIYFSTLLFTLVFCLRVSVENIVGEL